MTSTRKTHSFQNYSRSPSITPEVATYYMNNISTWSKGETEEVKLTSDVTQLQNQLGQGALEGEAEGDLLLRLVYRKFYKHLATPALLKLYLSTVRPILEYCSSVWDPNFLIKDIVLFERVQRFAKNMSQRLAF